ncbi:septal ring lytic transglycosylase RlpA family protein [Qipengyuania sp. MTN3-11]|uniref:septal ring lytic transglycosylase RlpA family protein n=1 Tax=Qipengyuania sp. MTN3-11 TaxID=3056557 RepID=UPI0036F447AA
MSQRPYSRTHLRPAAKSLTTALAGALALSATSVAMAETTPHTHSAASAATSAAAIAQQAGDRQFAALFASFAALPEGTVPPRAVDIDSFEPPVEAEPAATLIEGGTASYYGRKFHGRRTASGEAFDMNAMTAAHRTLPFGSRVRVTNPANGRTVTVTINDRGPFHGNRVIDVSRAAATELGLIQRGSGPVELALLD